MAELPTRRFGSTGFDVTTLGYGAMELRDADDTAAEAILNGVLDAGINLIDTSIDYGRSEELIGRFVSHRRSEYFLATKCGCVPGAGPGDHIHTAENIRTGVERSLRLLRTDYLDLVQFHRSLTPEEFRAEGGLQELLKMRDEGKVRFVGVSGTLPNMTQQIEMGVFDAFQLPYSALQRDHEEIMQRASAAGAAIIVRGGVARGAPTDWSGRTYYMLTADTMQSRWDQAQLDELLNGMTRMEFMLRFTISHPDLDTTIVGTKRVEHLRQNLDALLRGPLPDDVLAEAKRRLDAAGSVAQPL